MRSPLVEYPLPNEQLEPPRPDSNDRDPETYAVIGAAMEVHSVLGRGFLERVYQDALAEELALRAIPALREAAVPIFYKGRRLAASYRADFICFGTLLVELKAVSKLTSVETAQALHYLKATELPRALLLNFAAAKLEFRRLVDHYSD